MQSPTLAAAVGNLEAEAIAQVKILPNGLRLEKIDLAFLLLKKKKKIDLAVCSSLSIGRWH